MVGLNCRLCNKRFSVVNARAKSAKFCSARCRSRVNAVTMANTRREKARQRRPSPPPSPYAGTEYISLTQEKLTLVDSDIVSDINKTLWSVHTGIRSGLYAISGRILLHRLVIQAPPSSFVDHINGDTLDNRRSNLRLVGASENAWNSRRNNKSGYSGVTETPEGKWAARIFHDGQSINIGNFSDRIEAAYVRDQFAIALRGQYARLSVL